MTWGSNASNLFQSYYFLIKRFMWQVFAIVLRKWRIRGQYNKYGRATWLLFVLVRWILYVSIQVLILVTLVLADNILQMYQIIKI